MERYDSISYDFEVTDIPKKPEPLAAENETGEVVNIQNNSDNEAAPEKENENRSIPKYTVIIFQIALCMIIAAAAFVIKSIGGEVYEKVKAEYQALLCDSLITEQNNSINNSFVSEAVNETENRQREF